MEAGAVVNANKGCPGAYHPVATWVGWLGLVLARGPGLTEVADWLGHLYCILVGAFQVEGEHETCSPVSLTQREFQELFHCLA